MRRRYRIALALIVLFAVSYLLFMAIVRPRDDRDWTPDQAVQPQISLGSGSVHIARIRNFTYRSVSDYTPGYEEASYDLRDLRRVWYVVEPFTGKPGFGHTFLSFEFSGDRYLGVSIEIRKEKGEAFSVWKGMLRQYELMYVIGDERDLLKLRTNYRKDDVYLYPVQADPAAVRKLFVSMLERAQKLQAQPEFYNTLTNNCTTNIVAHINALAPGKVPRFSKKVLLPAYSDELAYDLGFFGTALPFPEFRAAHRINDLAERYADAPDFSRKIRGLE
jgi:hypothetical protein